MTITALNVAAAAALAAGTILRVEQENALLNGGSYIRDGVPEDFTGKLGLQLARQACLRYGADPGSVSGATALKFERACRPFLDDIGAGTGPQAKRPFEGGQCPGRAYYCDYDSPQLDPFPSCGITFTRVRAPQLCYGPCSISQQIINTVARCPGVSRYVLSVFNGDGSLAFDTGTGSNSDVGYKNIVFTPVDGQPDNCPGPAPDIRQPEPDPAPGPNPRPIVIAPDIDINASVNILAVGAIVVNIGTGPITIDPFGDEPTGGGGGGLPPGDVGEPGSPQETGGGGEAEGDAPAGKILTGLRVDFASPPVGAKEYAPGVFRGVCYVYMGTAAGLDHDPAGAMLRDGQFIFAEKENLTSWKVVANLGYNLRVTPYYATPPE